MLRYPLAKSAPPSPRRRVASRTPKGRYSGCVGDEVGDAGYGGWCTARRGRWTDTRSDRKSSDCVVRDHRDRSPGGSRWRWDRTCRWRDRDDSTPHPRSANAPQRTGSGFDPTELSSYSSERIAVEPRRQVADPIFGVRVTLRGVPGITSVTADGPRSAGGLDCRDQTQRR